MKLKLLLLFYIFFLTIFTHAQQNNFEQRVKENAILFQKDMDSAYVQLKGLIKEAKSIDNNEILLALLDKECHYFYNKAEVDKLLSSATNLLETSKRYHNKTYQAAANLYIAESYSMNELPSKALLALEKAEMLINESDVTPRNFYIKSNILLSQANIYYDQKQYQNSIHIIKKVINSGTFIENENQRNHFQIVNYSNIANIYLFTNIDSASYYVEKSEKLSKGKFVDENITGANYFIKGKVLQEHDSLDSALKNYLKAYEILNKTGDELNKKPLFEGLIYIYENLNKKDSVLIFKNKLSEFEKNNLESKYNSLKEIVKKENKAPTKNNYLIWGIVAISIIVIAILFMYLYKKTKSKNEQINPDEKLATQYDALVEMIKTDDPSFMTNFEYIYPDFRSKLLSINPELTATEIKFCALLKMNLSTKQIAQYTFIETRTVQNKKHRIRKKLEIAKNTDTYNWFNEI